MNLAPQTQSGSHQWLPYLLREPIALIAWLAASTSIGSLVLYLAGVAEFGFLLRCLLIPGSLVMLGCLWWARRQAGGELYQRIISALWAGLLATLTYDLVRVPVVLAGLPVFKAISYFGTVMLNQTTPSVKSEFAGWVYHLSNGIGFGVMYALLISRPSWWSAALWGLTLEGLMLLTPYAEIFGYRISAPFLATTITAHIVYGLTLWAALKYWLAGATFGAAALRKASLLVGPAVVALFGIGAIAADFYSRYAASIPPSPPDYLGSHLYATWDVLEPDRVASAWVWQRFVDKRARFTFVRPFTRLNRGIPFDLPEAEVRRSATRSATENLISARKLERNPALAKIARMTHFFEITPWTSPSDPESYELGQQLVHAVEVSEKNNPAAAMQRGFMLLDDWSQRHNTMSVGHQYVTRDKLELDKLASIWLIQRFVDKQATIQFVHADFPLTNGIPLDEPEAELRRDANNSCFETIMTRFNVERADLRRFSRIVREIELNPWGERQFAESVQLEKAIKTILDAHPGNPEACCQEAFAVFDKLLSSFANQRPQSSP